jgi:hypothetical protein
MMCEPTLQICAFPDNTVGSSSGTGTTGTGTGP